MTQQDHGVADLRGVREIAEFLYGSPLFRRRVYHLIATSKIPVFKIGSQWHARRCVLLKWIEEQEHRRSGSAANERTKGELETATD